MAGLGAETPQVKQGFNGEVKGTLTLLGQVLAKGNQFKHVGWQGQALVGGQLVEPADGRVAAVGRIVPVDFTKNGFDRCLHLGRRRAARLANVLDAVAATHGRAAQALKGGALVAGGEQQENEQ